MKNYNEMSVKEFCKVSNNEYDIVKDLLMNSKSCSYVKNPLNAIFLKVEKSNTNNKNMVVDYIYANLYGMPMVRTRDHKYDSGIELRG